jgi:rhodanese-related sulfurtransferase
VPDPRPRRLHFTGFLMLALAGAACSTTPDPKVTGGATVLSQRKFEQWIQADEEFLLLDVRTPAEYASGHIPGARNLPHLEVVQLIPQLADWRDGRIVLYDETGRRAAMTARALRSSGFLYVYVLDGHLPKWRDKGGRLE